MTDLIIKSNQIAITQKEISTTTIQGAREWKPAVQLGRKAGRGRVQMQGAENNPYYDDDDDDEETEFRCKVQENRCRQR